MPRGDGTGPLGMGPITGRAAGRCAGYSPGYTNQLPGGQGFGMGRGRGGRHGCGMGMGWRHGWASQGYPAMTHSIPNAPQDEITIRKNQAQFYGAALAKINKRIGDLEMEKK